MTCEYGPWAEGKIIPDRWCTRLSSKEIRPLRRISLIGRACYYFAEKNAKCQALRTIIQGYVTLTIITRDEFGQPKAVRLSKLITCYNGCIIHTAVEDITMTV